MANVKFNKVSKVMEYKAKNLSFREIATLMKSDVKTVYRWFEFGVGKKKPKRELSTVLVK